MRLVPFLRNTFYYIPAVRGLIKIGFVLQLFAKNDALRHHADTTRHALEFGFARVC